MPSTADRVRGLIQALGLTQGDFAAQIGLDASKLSKTLRGGRRFSSLDLARIAEVSGSSVDWLITGEENELAVAARSTGGSAEAALKHARRFTTMRSDLAEIGFPQPWRPVDATLGGTDAFQGQVLAEAALDRVGPVKPDADLAVVVEAGFGVDVAVVDLATDFDGLATSTDNARLVVLGTSQLPARQRFTLAHELGHLLAGDDQSVHLDQDVFAREQRSDSTERRANAFAAAFLMPAERLQDAVGSGGLTEESFASLACDLVVTPMALAYRLKDLRLVDSGTCDRLRRMTAVDAARTAGRRGEFARRAVEAGRSRPPGLLAQDAYAAYEAGLTTLRPYAQLIGVDVGKLRDALESSGSVAEAL